MKVKTDGSLLPLVTPVLYLYVRVQTIHSSP
jgi:hypothetical protein